MELMQLKMFVALVEERSVRGAAERVFRTPPAVSIAVGKLEEEITTPLFERSKRHEFRLTLAGRVLYDYAKRLLSLLSEAVSVLTDLANASKGTRGAPAPASEQISSSLTPPLNDPCLPRRPRTASATPAGTKGVARATDRRVVCIDETRFSASPEMSVESSIWVPPTRIRDRKNAPESR